MIDFQKLCTDHKIPYSTHSGKVTYGWLGVRCPYCGGTDYFLGFNLSSGFFSCWRCGGHPVPETIKRLLGADDYFSVHQIIKQYDTLTPVRARRSTQRVKSIDLPGKDFTTYELQYLESRGLDPQTIIKKYDLRSGGAVSRWKYRVVFPIFDTHGTIVSAMARAIHPAVKPPYMGLAAEESVIPWKDCLFAHHLMPPTAKAIGIMEGPFDVLPYGKGFVSTFGAEPSPYQIAGLLDYEQHIIVFDADETGYRKANKLADTLALYSNYVEVIRLPEGDPGKPSPEVREQLLQLRQEILER